MFFPFSPLNAGLTIAFWEKKKVKKKGNKRKMGSGPPCLSAPAWEHWSGSGAGELSRSLSKETYYAGKRDLIWRQKREHRGSRDGELSRDGQWSAFLYHCLLLSLYIYIYIYIVHMYIHTYISYDKGGSDLDQNEQVHAGHARTTPGRSRW